MYDWCIRRLKSDVTQTQFKYTSYTWLYGVHIKCWIDHIPDNYQYDIGHMCNINYNWGDPLISFVTDHAPFCSVCNISLNCLKLFNSYFKLLITHIPTARNYVIFVSGKHNVECWNVSNGIMLYFQIKHYFNVTHHNSKSSQTRLLFLFQLQEHTWYRRIHLHCLPPELLYAFVPIFFIIIGESK